MRAFISLFLLGFLPVLAGSPAAVGALKLESLPSEGIRSIVIKARGLNLKIRHTKTNSYSLKADSSLKWEKTPNGVLKIISSGYDSKKTWKSPSKPVVLELAGPSIPAQVFASFGQAVFSSWKASVFVSLLKGEIKGAKNKGEWQVSLKEGSLNLEEHQGAVTAKGFRNQWRVRSSRGNFRFIFNEGLLSVKKSQGDLHFEANKATITLARWKGSLKGLSGSGPVSAILEPSEADITTEEGPIHVSFQDSAPKISAYTEKGRIFGLAYIPTVFSGTSQKKAGRIRGRQKKGKVSLRSLSGNIYIK